MTCYHLAMPLRVGMVYTQMKLGRAYEHLNNLKAEIDRFIQGKPYTITRYDYLPKNWHILCVKQHITPDTVGVLIGEFAHTIRSGLDNLAWQLALLTTDKPNRLTAFPIESECPLPSNKSFKEKIANIPRTRSRSSNLFSLIRVSLRSNFILCGESINLRILTNIRSFPSARLTSLLLSMM
jgi:hypothetical protein